MRSAWGEWAPDRAPIGLGSLRTATNVRPDGVAYEPMPGIDELSSALTARGRGMISARDATGDVHTFAGDETKLYELNGSSWDDVSKVGGYKREDGKWMKPDTYSPADLGPVLASQYDHRIEEAGRDL